MTIKTTSASVSQIKAVVFDWAGTLVDFGSCAPVAAFIELFRQHGVEISVTEAREPMGKAKRDHISHLLAMPGVSARWKTAHGKIPDEQDVYRLYADFFPVQRDCLLTRSEPIPGAVKALSECRRRGLRIGSSSGYSRKLMDVVIPLASERGLNVDAVVAADEVPAGRPAPWMIWENARRLDVYPPTTIVTVDDTPVGVQAGLNAGTWTVGVVASGNLVGLSRQEYEQLSHDGRDQRLSTGYEVMHAAGADYVVDTVADLANVLTQIEQRLSRRERR